MREVDFHTAEYRENPERIVIWIEPSEEEVIRPYDGTKAVLKYYKKEKLSKCLANKFLKKVFSDESPFRFYLNAYGRLVIH